MCCSCHMRSACVLAMRSVDVNTVDVNIHQMCAWRTRQYADGKPRPLLRGVLHGILSLALLSATVVAAAMGDPGMALGFAGKFATYAASATFHLYPFATVTAVTRAFVMDLICVPASACGSIAPFVADTLSDIVREAGLATGVLLLNAALVLWQTRGQVGLKTHRSDAPRSALVGAYAAWAFILIGLTAGVGALWGAMLILFLLAAALSLPVTRSHELEPISARVPWHVPGVWSFHEDFHFTLAGADAVWLALALRFRADALR